MSKCHADLNGNSLMRNNRELQFVQHCLGKRVVHNAKLTNGLLRSCRSFDKANKITRLNPLGLTIVALMSSLVLLISLLVQWLSLCSRMDAYNLSKVWPIMMV